MRYLAKKNFLGKQGLITKGAYITADQIKGDLQKAIDEEFIVSESSITAEELVELEKKIKARRAELAELEASKKKIQSKAHGEQSSEQEAAADGEDEELELGEDEYFEDELDLEEAEGDAPEAPKKKKKKKVRKA